jgi:polyhydroxybutyrate depolymerase
MRNLLIFLSGIILLILNACSRPQDKISSHFIVSGDTERSFLLYIPPISDKSKTLPLVFNFHGSGATPENQIVTTNMNVVAESLNFMVAYPAGAFTNELTTRSWNANNLVGVDDVQFVRDMIETIDNIQPVDPLRIYATGFSGGARMSSRLACDLSDRIAAIAPVSGILFPPDCQQKITKPVPVITFHSVDDRVNTYKHNSDSRSDWYIGVESSVDLWRQQNGCIFSSVQDSPASEINHFSWKDCSEKGEVQFYQLNYGGHTWPGSMMQGAAPIDTSRLVAEFFLSHTL